MYFNGLGPLECIWDNWARIQALIFVTTGIRKSHQTKTKFDKHVENESRTMNLSPGPSKTKTTDI